MISHAPPKRSMIDRIFGARTEMPLALMAGVTLALGFVLWNWVGPRIEQPLVSGLGEALVWISLGLGAVHGAKAAWESLRHFRPDIDVLMVVGAGLAAGIGHPEEGALLLFMFTLAGALEHRALARTKEAVARLNKLMPNQAMRRDTSGAWTLIDPETLATGDVVLIRPGETAPADGIIIDGHSDIDQSTLTGESLPRSVTVGDQVFAGTINQNGALEVRVSRPVTESSLKRILRLVIEAQETRQPVQRLIDTFSTPYTIVVLIGAAAAFFGFLFLGDLTFSAAAYRAITLLVVASPCALVISTPTATLCGLSRAARAGVLIKGGDALERLANITRVALDKTGTLTTGRIEVTRVDAVAACDTDSMLSIAMAAEQRSTHPIAAAIVRLAHEHHLHPAQLAALTNVPGRGIEGTFANKPVRVGNYDFCEPLIPICFRSHTRKIIEHVMANGGKPVVMAHDDQTLVLTLADTPRQGAEDLTRELRAAGVRSVTMLTGDTRIIAERLAQQLGIENVRSELLPEDKVEHIKRIRLEPDHGGLAVIGDGVNDAPALAVADVGLAMGGIGADAALETADVVLLHDDLNRIPWSFELARRVRRIMVANLTFATSVIAVLALFTVLGVVPLPLGVIGHEGSTLLVVANSLRLLAHREP
jgi:Cd2+/Zn2+-exporting ATPase